jgi:D-3-phosphoglycerate dehydrogenase
MKPVVFVPEPIAECGLALLRPTCEWLTPWIAEPQPSPAQLKEMLSHADAVIVRLFPITDDDLASAPRLKVIAKHGVGVDTIDVASATRRGIPVVFTPTANSNAVAEHTMALLLALARHVQPAANAMQAGRFHERTKFAGVELAGRTLGVLGLGRVGRRVAEIAKGGFGMRVIGYDPFVFASSLGGLAEIEPSLETLLAAADFLTLHLPLTTETRHLIDAPRLQLLKPACRIVNTSRGEIIDEPALAQALRIGRIAGAALDVFQQEPLPEEHPFFSTPNLLLTPHLASSTRDSLDRMASDAAQGVLDVLNRRRPAYLVNPECLGVESLRTD